MRDFPRIVLSPSTVARAQRDAKDLEEFHRYDLSNANTAGVTQSLVGALSQYAAAQWLESNGVHGKCSPYFQHIAKGDKYDLEVGGKWIDVKGRKLWGGRHTVSPNDEWGVFERPLEKYADWYLFVSCDAGRGEVMIVGAITKVELLRVGLWKDIQSDKGPKRKLFCYVHQTVPAAEWMETVRQSSSHQCVPNRNILAA